jgi:hypothetical protein
MLTLNAQQGFWGVELWQSLDGKGARIDSFVERLEKIIHKSTEIVK